VFRQHCGVYRRFEAWFKGVMLPGKLAAQTPTQNPAQGGAQQPVVPPAVPGPQNPAVVQPGPPPQFLVPTTPQSTGLLTPKFNVVNDEFLAGIQRTNILQYQTEFHQKFAIPLACFCFVLIGMALAVKYPGGGIGLVIGGSLVIFLGFYILLQGGKGAAQAGNLNPAVAMYAPLVIFMAIGIWAVNSANREMGIARSGGLLDTLMGLFQGGAD
jgi:hypothetical protein